MKANSASEGSRRDSRRTSGTPTAASEVNEDHGQGWTQLTDHGKIYLSKKEKNVFILEGTRSAGFSACGYRGSAEESKMVDSGVFTLTSELKVVPGESCSDQEVFLLIDCMNVADLSSGCDFCGVHLSFDTRELRVESHRLNATTQTLFAQPSCSLLRPSAYVTIAVAVDRESLAVSLNGVSLISNLPTSRAPRTGGKSALVGLAVYGKTRCYMRRFRVSAGSSVGSPAGKATPPAESDASSALMPYVAPAPAQASNRGSADRRGRSQQFANVMTGMVPQGCAGSASEDMDLAAAIERDIVVGDLNVGFNDIGGLDDAKRAMNEAVLLPLLLPEFFTGIRKPWKGVLLFGPPGTGKTMLAKAVASCAENVTFFNCSTATLTSKWRGESEKLLRALFTTARARTPCILFFDEIDSLLSQRGSAAEHEASRRFKSEFLIHMDGLLSDQRPDSGQVGHLLVLATSNAPWDLDEALRRRLEKRIYIPLPDEAARLKMFADSMQDIQLAADIDFASLAARTEHYSGADIKLICRDASMNPMRRVVDGLSPFDLVRLRDEGKLSAGALPVQMADFEAALSNVQPSVSSHDTARYLDWARDFGSN
mmetsp:Transcript_7240/g.11831  ORF Transcript_7240/g.11831 Transcript_7240/m.11831 type:complete len:598 (-) Transcript_7240:75-1868(-)